jgi:hypothetical protein
MLTVMLFTHANGAENSPEHPYRHSVVDIPVSLAAGTVKTPEFNPVTSWYWIMLQVEKPLPFDKMICMMGTPPGHPLEHCGRNDPLVRTHWVVWDGEEMVAQGSESNLCACQFTNDHIVKFLGKFPARSGRTYVATVTFTKDGTPLNVANPHLIIVKIGEV